MKKMKTVKYRQLMVFLTMIGILLLVASGIFYFIRRLAVQTIYGQMSSSAEYYVSSIETQMSGIIQEQSEILSDRQVVFLADESLLSDYERRNALLSVQERLFFLVSSSNILENAVLYIPGTGYVIQPLSIREMTDTDWLALGELQSQAGTFVPDGGNLLYTLSNAPSAMSSPASFCLQIVIDREELIAQLDNFMPESGGAFWYDGAIDWYLEDSGGQGVGETILERVADNASMSEIRVGSMVYLVSITRSEYFGMLVQYCSRDAVLKEINFVTALFYGFMVLAVVYAVIFSNYTEHLVNRPLQKLYQAFERLQMGELDIRIDHEGEDEFAYIYSGFHHTVRELSRMIDEVYVQKNLAAQAELKQLQSQINPHFFYNSFFLFSGRVAREDYEGARELADYLGVYFRYLARNTSDEVALADEMLHAEAYARIQESRFSARISLEWEPLPQEAETIRVPRLIVQPILENAYKYGLENVEENGILRISYEWTPEEFRICIENNGAVTEEAFAAMEELLTDGYGGEVTGMINIHRRLKNYFKGRGGLCVKRGEMGGVLVVMTLPWKEETYAAVIDRG